MLFFPLEKIVPKQIQLMYGMLGGDFSLIILLQTNTLVILLCRFSCS